MVLFDRWGLNAVPMKDEERQLLYCLTAYRLGQKTAQQVGNFITIDWPRLYRLAAVHKLGAVVYETLRGLPGFCREQPQLAARWRRETMIQAASQLAKTQRLLRLTGALEVAGVRYAVVKGALCREMYTRPELRPSGDEDILIAPEDFSKCSAVLIQDGMEHTDEEDGPVTHWLDRQTGLHVELHTELFSSKLASDHLLNSCFSQQLNHTVSMPVSGGTVCTFQPTYHFLFLVCHAIKHFIAGGFGIRTLCDIVTYAEQHQEAIDQDAVYVWLEKANGRVFLDQVLSIGQEFLSMNPKGWAMSAPAHSAEMLEDILDAGIYGQSTMSRRHSGALVLRAAEEGQTRPSVIRAAFPPKEQLVGRYPILEKRPALLPVMWIRRLGAYGLELIKSQKSDNSLRDNLALGKQRTEMMIRYGIIPRDKTKN